jgi:hypothetical protein
MVQTLLHTEPLQCSADAFWEAAMHLDDLLPALKPDHFTKSVFLQGFGGPGSIRVVKMGPGMTALIGGLVINPPLLQILFLLCTICNRDFLVRVIWTKQAAGSDGLIDSLRDSV